MLQHAQNKPTLPTNRAFVLQFHTEAEVATGHFTGRVEHVASGRSLQFHSVEELLTFMKQILNERKYSSGGCNAKLSIQEGKSMRET
jgi:hypothetical protein